MRVLDLQPGERFGHMRFVHAGFLATSALEWPSSEHPISCPNITPSNNLFTIWMLCYNFGRIGTCQRQSARLCKLAHPIG